MTESGNEMVMPVAPMMGGYGNNGGFSRVRETWLMRLSSM